MPAGPTWDEVSALAGHYDCMALGGGLLCVLDTADRVKRGWAHAGAAQGSDLDLVVSLAFECRTREHCGIVPEPSGDDWAYLVHLYGRVHGIVARRQA